jgi:hypothetical protein
VTAPTPPPWAAMNRQDHDAYVAEHGFEPPPWVWSPPSWRDRVRHSRIRMKFFIRERIIGRTRLWWRQWRLARWLAGWPLDDHGNPAVATTCDNCGRQALCLYWYNEASGPCELDPDYAERMQMEPNIIPGGAALRGDGGPLCGNCVAALAFCVDREACKRECAAGGRP